MAQTKEGQSSRSIYSLTPDGLSSGQQGLQTQKSHRTNVLQAQELATHRNRYDRYAQNYLSTVLDDFSRYIIAWKLCSTMNADDVTATLDLALSASGLDQAMDSILESRLTPSAATPSLR